MRPQDLIVGDVEVVLNLEIEVSRENRARLFEFCRRAFPVYESVGGNRFVLYEDEARPGRFNEIGYYRTMADYRRSEDALKSDPAHVRLLAEWRSLLAAPPKVTIARKSAA